jgi:hypothetical protein
MSEVDKEIYTINALNKIVHHCRYIKTGKPCSCEAIQDQYVDKVIQYVKEQNLKSHIEPLCKDWKTIWIYRDDYMLNIIKNLPDTPKTTFDHWVLGKAFGYSDEAIREYVNTIKETD